MNSENQELLKLFEPLRVADVRDGMDWMGYHHYGTMDYKIRPLYRTKAVGIARTARYLPYEGPDPEVRETHIQSGLTGITEQSVPIHGLMRLRKEILLQLIFRELTLD